MDNPMIPLNTQNEFMSLIRKRWPVARAAKKVGISNRSGHRIVAANVPFQGEPQAPPNVPPPAWNSDQPPPPLRRPEFQKGYTDHTFRALAPPLAFDGWDLTRVRNAISAHRQGIFLESSALSTALMSFGPVLQALRQRVAPVSSLPRYIRYGTSPMSQTIGKELEDLYAPGENGLSPSPFLPVKDMIAANIELCMMGFSCFQSVLGEVDDELGIQPVYVRRWPSWAMQYYRYRKTFVALTSEGPVDIGRDSHFVLVASYDEPHFYGSVIPLGEETVDGKMVQRARASYVNRYGNPKLVGIMPEGVAVRSEEGDAFFEAMGTLRGPDGYGLLPAGGQVEYTGLESGQSSTFKDSLDSIRQFVFGVILGSDGTTTLAPGGAYSSPLFAEVKRALVSADVSTIVQGVNEAAIRPYEAFNYQSSIDEEPGYTAPVFDMPLPDPDRDARIKSLSERQMGLVALVKAEKEAGFRVTQDRVDHLSQLLDVSAPTLEEDNGSQEKV